MTHHGAPCWYELYTSDIDAAQGFYSDILGWQIANSGMPGMDYRLASAGDTMVAGMMQTADQPAAWTIYFAVDNADDTFAAALASGATALIPPADIPNTGRFAVMRDPQGASFGILQPLPGGQGGAFDQAKTGTGNWNEIIGADPAAALKFYCDLFGWTLSTRVDMGGMIYQLFAWNGTDIGGSFAIPGGQNRWKAYFGVASAKAAVQAVTVAGGTVTHGPDEVPGGAYTVQIRDPQGVELALTGPA